MRRRATVPGLCDEHLTACRIAVVAALVLVAALATASFWPLLSHTPFFLFFVAVLLGAYWGDRLSILFGVALATLSAVFVLAGRTPAADRPLDIAVFATLTVSVAWLVVSWRKADEARRRSNESLRASEERYRRFFEDDLTGNYVSRVDGTIVECNPAFLKILGFRSVEDARARPAWDLYSRPNDCECLLEVLEENGRIEHHELELRRRDGSPVHVVQNAVGEFDSAGRLVAMHGYLFDVTERKRVEAELASSQAMLRAVVRNAPLVLWAVDERGVFTLSEGKGLEPLGLHPGEVVGQSVFDVYAQLPAILDYHRRALRGETVTGLVEVGQLQFESWYSPLHDAAGKIGGAVGVAVDVTERRHLEAQLRHDQRMKAIGQLAGGIAHDFNNLLTAIIGYADALLLEWPENHPNRQELGVIRDAGQSAASLTMQLLAFSRRQVIRPRSLNVNDVVADVASLLRRLLGENVALTTALDPGLDRVWADPVQFQQLILNLAVNARDAMPEGGSLTVATENATLDEQYSHDRSIAPAPGPYVRLSVTDTGCGMDAETQARIFEPFYTTKAAGKGTGLGLATVYGIVKQSNGYVWVYSEPGRGTTFKVYIPAYHGEDRTTARDIPAVAETARGTETILLVEDDEFVRTLAARGLREIGYAVLEAPTAERAIDVARGHPGAIHLLVTDLILPFRSGTELAQLVECERPGTPVLFISGYAGHHLTRPDGVLDAGVSFLEKPFTPRVLAGKVRQVLDREHR